MSRSSPVGAFAAGLVAGFVGSLAQNLFFAWTKKLAPAPAPAAFEPVEPEQVGELPTQTVARRVLEHVVQRGPLEHPAGAAQLVHLGFGSAWGSAYGLLAGTLPQKDVIRSGLTFGFLVWLASDDILLPAFKLSAWPHHYPVKSHLYALAAHAVYGAAVATTFTALQRAANPATAALGAYWLTRRVPGFARPTARRALQRGLRVALPVRQAVLALT
jgi:uncharacterized membrane protein YagU involved in acid resistance